jgi:tetratricopeptide (TPR) repeat protein
MTSIKIRIPSFLLLLALSSFAFSQQSSPAPQSAPQTQMQSPPASSSPRSSQETQAPATPSTKSAASKVAAAASANAPKKTPDRAAAYYHFTLAHIYEELVASYARSEFANKAVEEYKLAIANDPDSEYLNAGLAELYAKTGRIRDAVLEAQDIIKRDPKNLEARKLLGRIYLRSLGDLQSGTQSQEVLKLAIEQFEQIVSIDHSSVEDHLLLGRLYRLNNDSLKAESEFKTAVRLQPDSEEALTSLAYLYNEQGDPARAVRTLDAVPDSSRTSRLYQALGYTYEQQHEYKKAIDAYRHAVDQDHDNLDSVRGLAQNLMNDGQTDAALDQYNSIADADPQDVQAQLRIAEILRRLGKFDQALDHLKKAEALVQDSLEVPYNIALVYQAQGRYDEAAQLMTSLLKKGEKADGNYTTSERNNRTVFLERLGDIYRDQDKNALALDTFRKILQLGDDNASRGYQQIIETYRGQKQWPQALAAAREATARLPKDRQLQLALAQQLADTGKGDEAVAMVKSLLQNNHDDRDIYIALSQVYTRLRRFPEAEQAIAQAEKLSTKPDEKDYVDFVEGSIYEREKKFDLAEAKFKQVIAGDPHNAVALNYLGYMMADRGVRLEEALGYIKKATEQEPENGAYLDSLGWAYYKLGNYDLAEENLRKASQKITNDGTVQDHLGDLYFKTGRVKLAAAHWERALEEWGKTVAADVETADVAKVQKKLESARIKLAREGAARQ